MQDVTDFFLVFAFNIMIFGTAIWVVLRLLEKALDILLKNQQYERAKKEAEA